MYSTYSSSPPRLIPTSDTLVKTLDFGHTVPPATFFVPGGRYLLTGDAVALSLWDSGPPDYPASSDLVLITRTEIESHPVAKDFGLHRISARILPNGALRIALAVGGTWWVSSSLIAFYYAQSITL